MVYVFVSKILVQNHNKTKNYMVNWQAFSISYIILIQQYNIVYFEIKQQNIYRFGG